MFGYDVTGGEKKGRTGIVPVGVFVALLRKREKSSKLATKKYFDINLLIL